MPDICVDPANFGPVRSSYTHTPTAGDSGRALPPTRETRFRDAPSIVAGRVLDEISHAATSVDVQQVSWDETRSKTKDDIRPPAKLLKPYDLALELQQMCGQGDMDGAFRRLQSTPRDAQNTSVWNTMISLCTNAGRYKRAYEVFTDMKRRGFSPNAATFSTLLKGLSQIDDWSKHSKQLANAHTLYGYYMDHIRSVKYHEPDNTKELNTVPLVFYLSILGEVGDRQKIFDVFFAMDAEGLFAPDKYLFCSMFDAITKCQERRSDSNDEISVSNTAKSDAKYIWLQVEKAVQKQRGFELDSRVIGAAIRALTRGRASDQALALDIATKHLGFAMFGERATLRLSRFLTPWTLDVTLTLCNTMQRYKLCVHFMRQVIERLDFDKPHERQIVDRSHIHKLLRAHSALARRGSPDESLQASEVVEWCLENDAIYQLPKLRPDRQTYHLLLMACWRNGDWARLMRSFELMTGIRATSFQDSNQEQGPPKLPERSVNSNHPPDLETMSFIVRTALGTKAVNHYKHAMWLADCVDLGAMLQNPRADAFYRARVAMPLIRIINYLRGEVPAEKYLTWNHLLQTAEEVMGDNEKAATDEHRKALGRAWSFKGDDDTLPNANDNDPDK